VLVLGDHTSEAWAGCLGFVESAGADGVGVWFRQNGAPPSVFDILPAQKLLVVGTMPRSEKGGGAFCAPVACL
jgi:hypothetical protein